MARRAKIVCTLGPATSTPEAVAALVTAGMDVARLNFSHGKAEEHAARLAMVRDASDASRRAVGVLADLQGPKIRLGTFVGGRAQLDEGTPFVISTLPCEGDATRASTTYEALAADVQPGDEILVDDGRLVLQVIGTDATDVTCLVVEGGPVSNHKGLNLPGVNVSSPALTEKDIADLSAALAMGVDVVAMSFVRSPDDAEQVRRAMAAAGRVVPVIAKLEKPEAVACLEEIVLAFDGIMVARGDLGVELPLEQVPVVQKQAVELARAHGRPVIVATQMLESMITASRPTRAEASDVANAVLDGADALMLSAETSIGEHAVGAVRIMSRIVVAAEERSLARVPTLPSKPVNSEDAVAKAAARLADTLGAAALVAFTISGSTARYLSAHRSPIPLLAFTTDPAVRSQLALQWGVETFVVAKVDSTDAMVAQVDRAMLENGRGSVGDRVVVVAGTPPGMPGNVNTIRIHELGSV